LDWKEEFIHLNALKRARYIESTAHNEELLAGCGLSLAPSIDPERIEAGDHPFESRSARLLKKRFLSLAALEVKLSNFVNQVDIERRLGRLKATRIAFSDCPHELTLLGFKPR
jgi:hypothetical protein